MIVVYASFLLGTTFNRLTYSMARHCMLCRHFSVSSCYKFELTCYAMVTEHLRYLTTRIFLIDKADTTVGNISSLV